MKKKVLVTLGLGFGLFCLAPAAQASLVFYLGGCDFSADDGGTGSCGGSGADLPANALKMTFMNNGLDSVRLTIDAANMPADTDKISHVWFNVDTGLDFDDLSFSYVSGEAVKTPKGIVAGGNVDGAGIFDIEFRYPTSSFGPGESSVYNILGSGLTENSFNQWSTGGPLSFLAAFHLNITEHANGNTINNNFHINNSNGNGVEGDSGHYGATPAPATLLLFGSGLFGLAAVGRKRKGGQ